MIETVVLPLFLAIVTTSFFAYLYCNGFHFLVKSIPKLAKIMTKSTISNKEKIPYNK